MAASVALVVGDDLNVTPSCPRKIFIKFTLQLQVIPEGVPL